MGTGESHGRPPPNKFEKRYLYLTALGARRIERVNSARGRFGEDVRAMLSTHSESAMENHGTLIEGKTFPGAVGRVAMG